MITMRKAYLRCGVRVIFRFCEAKRPSQSGTSGKNGADQIRKPLEEDGIHPQIGEAGCASFFGFAKQNVRLVRDEREKRRRPNKKTARRRRHTATNRRSRVRVIFRFCEAKRPSQSGTSGKNGADQIRKPLEEDGIHPQIGEAGCASFFGFAKQNVRLVRDEREKRRRPNKKTARRRRHTATNRRSRVRVNFRFCRAKRPSQSGMSGKTAQTK